MGACLVRYGTCIIKTSWCLCNYIGRVEDIQYSSVSSASKQSECGTVVQYLNELSAILHHFAQLYGDKAMEIEDMTSSPDTLIRCPVTQSGTPGRPSIIISQAQFETLIELGFNYTTIASMFGISPRTLLCRSYYVLPIGCSFTEISDSDLDSSVRSITQVLNYYCTMNCMLKFCSYILIYWQNIHGQWPHTKFMKHYCAKHQCISCCNCKWTITSVVHAMLKIIISVSKPYKFDFPLIFLSGNFKNDCIAEVFTRLW